MFKFNFHRWRRTRDRTNTTNTNPPGSSSRAGQSAGRARRKDKVEHAETTVPKQRSSTTSPHQDILPTVFSVNAVHDALERNPSPSEKTALTKDSPSSSDETAVSSDRHLSSSESPPTRNSSVTSYGSPPQADDLSKLEFQGTAQQAGLTHVESSDSQLIPVAQHHQEEGGQYVQSQWSQTLKGIVSPQSLVQSGNSDPFDAFPIPVTAGVNGLMSFGRDCLIPAMYFTNSGTFAPAVAKVALKTNTPENPTSAYALLAYYATTLAIIVPQDSHGTRPIRQSLVYRTKCSEALRGQLAKKNAYTSPATAAMIYTAFRTETVARNQAAAAVHGEMLRRMLEVSAEHIELDIGFVSLVFYHDMMRATTFMTRPIFRIHDWMPKMFEKIWKSKPQGPDLAPHAPLDPMITDPNLRAIFTDFSEFFDMSCVTYSRPHVRTFELNAQNWFWFVSRNEYFSGRLLCLYLDIAEQMDLSMDVLPQVELTSQACVCLAALYQIRSFRNNPLIGGIAMYDGNLNVLRHLRMRLEFLEQVAIYREEATKMSVNARLYSLYIGAVAEQARRCRYQNQTWRTRLESDDPMRGRWFTRKLITLCEANDISSWIRLRQCLLGFMYCDYIEPSGADWFEGAMKAAFPWNGQSASPV